MLVEPLSIVMALAAGWALIMPALMWLSMHYDGISASREAVA
jgi:hypothetical protein